MSVVPPPYTPSLAPPARLDATLVGRDRLRTTLTDNLLATVREGGARFELVVGPPGSGKTHLLGACAHRLRAALQGHAGPLVIAEHANVSSLVDLLARMVGTLGGDLGAARAQAARTGERASAVAALTSQIDALAGDRPLVVLVERLGALLEADGAQAEALLRAHLQERGRWSLLTTDTEVRPVFASADRPLFGTFAIRRLTELTVEDCEQLVKRRTGRKAAVAVRVVHHLLGGWPRPFALLDTSAAAPEAVTRLADALAPELLAVQERLPPGRWAVLGCLLEATRPLGVGEIAERLYGVTSQNASSQLVILRREGLVSALRVGRESMYEPALATHWLAATRRAAPERLAQLSGFLTGWYRASSAPPPAGLELAEGAGVEPSTLAAMRRAAAEGSADTAAQLRFAHADRAERALLLRCLEGIEAAAVLGGLLDVPGKR